MRKAATDSACGRAACPVQLGRIALPIGCKARDCSGPVCRQSHDSSLRHCSLIGHVIDAAEKLVVAFDCYAAATVDSVLVGLRRQEFRIKPRMDTNEHESQRLAAWPASGPI